MINIAINTQWFKDTKKQEDENEDEEQEGTKSKREKRNLGPNDEQLDLI